MESFEKLAEIYDSEAINIILTQKDKNTFIVYGDNESLEESFISYCNIEKYNTRRTKTIKISFNK